MAENPRDSDLIEALFAVIYDGFLASDQEAHLAFQRVEALAGSVRSSIPWELSDAHEALTFKNTDLNRGEAAFILIYEAVYGGEQPDYVLTRADLDALTGYRQTVPYSWQRGLRIVNRKTGL